MNATSGSAYANFKVLRQDEIFLYPHIQSNPSLFSKICTIYVRRTCCCVAAIVQNEAPSQPAFVHRLIMQ